MSQPEPEPMETDVEVVPEDPALPPLLIEFPPAAAQAPSGSHTWKIAGFSERASVKRFSSEVFEVAGRKWHLNCFPRGNLQGNTHLSLYLECSAEEEAKLSAYEEWRIKLTMKDSHVEGKDVVKITQHCYTKDSMDWGFSEFVLLVDLHSPDRGFLVDDTLTIEVQLHMNRLTDWNSYDSKAETGCVGLKNQGATCYMNSLLQTLFHIPVFRKAVYHMPTSEAADVSLPLALQSLFYKMQFGDSAVSTIGLTRSFGWDSADSFTQHDVQELNRVLCDKLDAKMKGTSVEGTVASLFEGHTQMYVECVDVPYQSQRRESFLDLQLDVKGCRDVLASFRKYVEEEVLDGDNKYAAEGHGLQSARKGVRFLDLPPVLQLHLKRFEYDFQRDCQIKINDRYEFPEDLDLSPFLSAPPPTADGPPLPVSCDARYVLHSVLVHSGGASGGHYYAFVRPDPQGKPSEWLKFDDERVTRENAERAVQDNYGEGGFEVEGVVKDSYSYSRWSRVSNAYMLVYVRASEAARVVCEVPKSAVPEHVVKRLDMEKADKARARAEAADAHLHTIVKLATAQDIAAHVSARNGDTAFGLVNWDAPSLLQLRVKDAISLRELRVAAAARFPPAAGARWWVWSRRENGTMRVDQALEAKDETATVTSIASRQTAVQLPRFSFYSAPKSKKEGDLVLFLELYPSGSVLPPPPPAKSDILLFIKFYDPVGETLTFLGPLLLPTSQRVSDLAAAVAQLAAAHLPLAPELLLFEEIRSEPQVRVDPLADLQMTLKVAELVSGDIIVAQQKPSAGSALRFSRAPDFMEFVMNRLLVTFRELPGGERGPLAPPQPAPSAPPYSVQLELSRTATYSEVTASLADALQLPDPELLRLTGVQAYTSAPRSVPFRYAEHNSLAELLKPSFGKELAEGLFFEVLELPLRQVQELKALKVDWCDARGELVKPLLLRVPKGATVQAALEALDLQLAAQGLLPPDAAPGPPHHRLRLLEIVGGRVSRLLPPATATDLINEFHYRLRCEAIPRDQLPEAMAPGERLVTFCHVRMDSYKSLNTFGDPLLVKVGPEETLCSVRRRIAAVLGLPFTEPAAPTQDADVLGADDAPVALQPPSSPRGPPAAADFAAWRFGKVSYYALEPLNDGDMLLEQIGTAPDASYVGMEHEERRGKRTASSMYRAQDRPVRIAG